MRRSELRRLRRAALVRLMASDEALHLTRAEIAARVGLKAVSVRDYLDAAFWADVAAVRARQEADPLAEVDSAMLEAARAGHVGAARLVYGRLGQKVEADGPEGIEEVLRELEEVKARLLEVKARQARGGEVTDADG